MMRRKGFIVLLLATMLGGAVLLAVPLFVTDSGEDVVRQVGGRMRTKPCRTSLIS